MPDPMLPFLGVHLTRMLDGSVHAGPNAVLALRREGYRWTDVSAEDVAEVAAFPAPGDSPAATRSRPVWRRSRLVPAVTEDDDDIVRHGSGVRAQAVRRDDSLVDGFLIETTRDQVHVLNAPSLAATSAHEIARHIADRSGPPGRHHHRT